jgi:hypothetical protein
MKSRVVCCLALILVLALAGLAQQKQDEGYTKKIKEYTTEPFFLTELVDHLPASDRVPTPEKVLGYPVGAPDKLTYSKDIYRYMNALSAATPRVKVFPIGKTEEGREMIVVVVSDEENIRQLDRYKELTAKLADPRSLPPGEAEKVIAQAKPFYWASGSIHSPETGSPEMLVELAYRLAVEETPFIQAIRKNSIIMITPLVEVDGHDREVDVYSYRKAHPDKPAPPLAYWGHYVAHDNNRDAIGMGLALSRNMMKTFLEYHPQVLHDLHESVPFLYISTGMGPYNAWLDPIVIDEWHQIAYQEVDEMTKRGVPGIWTHGYYDGWAPNYMFYVANGHNSIGRFYETFGAGGADTSDRTVPASSTARTWYRPNPPLPRVRWSIRNNINLQQSAILFAMKYVADNKDHFLHNFYLKSQRSVAKATAEGPAAWVIYRDPRPVEAAGLANLLRLQGVEVSRLDKEFTVKDTKIPEGAYVVRMDQPYSRMADMLLDTQYYNANDARPYDDTGWTLGALRNVKTLRVTDGSILKAPMQKLASDVHVDGAILGSARTAAYIINHNTDNTLATLRFRLGQTKVLAAEQAFKHEDHDFAAGSFIIPVEGNGDIRARLEPLLKELGVSAYAAEALPKVTTHPISVPRVALLHTWTSTQTEGWFRMAFDKLNIPYTYIADRVVRDTENLRQKFDVILFPPVGGGGGAGGGIARLINGTPGRNEPIPFKATDEMPNIATAPDQSDDTRGGMGLEGVLHLKKFVEEGGALILIGGNSAIPINTGMIEGVTIADTPQLQARGTVVNVDIADAGSPITYGYDKRLAVYFSQAPVFRAGGGAGGFGGGGGPRGAPGGGPPGGGPEAEAPAGGGAAGADGQAATRATGRGTLTDPDIPQGRAPYTPPPPQRAAGEQPEGPGGAGRAAMPAPETQPRVVVRFADEKELPVSGMLAGGAALARTPAVIDAPLGKGHIVMFANNPMWRNETQGSYFLVFNTILNYDNLGVGRPAQPAGARGGARRGPGDDDDSDWDGVWDWH